MQFNTIYRNGKPQYFFIKTDRPEEFNFIQPYFLVTSSDRPRFGRILEMDCLFSGSVWQGRQSHGYGYSCSADVYGSLIDAIHKVHKNQLSEAAVSELSSINRHENELQLSPELLAELAALNSAALEKRWA